MEKVNIFLILVLVFVGCKNAKEAKKVLSTDEIIRELNFFDEIDTVNNEMSFQAKDHIGVIHKDSLHLKKVKDYHLFYFVDEATINSYLILEKQGNKKLFKYTNALYKWTVENYKNKLIFIAEGFSNDIFGVIEFKNDKVIFYDIDYENECSKTNEEILSYLKTRVDSKTINKNEWCDTPINEMELYKIP